MARPKDESPEKARANPDETSKAADFTDPAKKHGQDPEEVAERMGTTGKDLGHA